MTADPRWEQVKQVFQAALDREPQQRAAFVRDACGADAALEAEVESLLDAHERAGSFAEGPAMHGRALGETFGPYEITGWLGSGAMGEVYRARDTKLHRDVALKLLPQLFAFDVERRARFTREAQILASLNHPNIATIYGLEQAGGREALVLELIDGPTLADRIQQGAMPSDEVMSIAKQIAKALEAAHEQGIVHRDLKPSNIKLQPNGIVKVLDFGLAKAMAPARAGADGGEPTRFATAATREGVIVGTIGYMSPEQARGKAVDKRTDIWAFGCVIYEMLTGTPAFAGDDATEMLAAIVRGEPAWEALPAGTPPNVSNLLRRCLTKDPHDRLRDIGDARLAMEGAFDTQPDALASSASAPVRTRFAAYAAVLLLGSALTGVAVWSRLHTGPPRLARFAIQLGAGESFSLRGRHLVTMSPDGRFIVYAANEALYLRPLDQLQARRIAGTEDRGRSPFFSPDGQGIGFWADDQLKRVALSGGAPVTLCRVPAPWGVSWENDNTILIGEGPEGIWRVPDTGGMPEVIVKVASGEAAHGPHLLPGGEWVLFTLLPKNTRSWDEAQIVAQSLRTGDRRVLVRGGHDGRYVGTGHLVYALNRNLLAVPFDADDLVVTGDATTVLDGVADADENTTGASHFDVTSEGGLVYVPRLTPRMAHALVWVDREGREEAIKTPVREYIYPRISPDGTRVAVAIDVRNQENDVWIWDLARETLTRLTFDPGFDEPPAWTPDSRRIAFASDRDGGGLFWQAADGTGPVERLTQGRNFFPTAFSPDALKLVFSSSSSSQVSSDIVTLTPGSRDRPSPLIHTPFRELNAEISPDGRWIAYQSDESGHAEIYVRPFPNIDGGRWQVSTDGGERPLWARNGRELFYVTAVGLMTVPIETTTAFSNGKARKLLDDRYRYFFGDVFFQGRTYDISPDGKRFLVIKQAAESGTEDDSSNLRLVVVLNWTEELKQLAPPDGR